jgi:hypothetical protein
MSSAAMCPSLDRGGEVRVRRHPGLKVETNAVVNKYRFVYKSFRVAV